MTESTRKPEAAAAWIKGFIDALWLLADSDPSKEEVEALLLQYAPEPRKFPEDVMGRPFDASEAPERETVAPGKPPLPSCTVCGKPMQWELHCETDHDEVAPGKYRIDRPCSACGDGDIEMKYHDHHSPFRKAAVAPATTLGLRERFYKLRQALIKVVWLAQRRHFDLLIDIEQLAIKALDEAGSASASPPEQAAWDMQEEIKKAAETCALIASDTRNQTHNSYQYGYIANKIRTLFHIPTPPEAK